MRVCDVSLKKCCKVDSALKKAGIKVHSLEQAYQQLGRTNNGLELQVSGHQHAQGHSSSRQQFVGELTGQYRQGLAEVIVKNRFSVHDHVELMTPQAPLHWQITHLENQQGELISVAPGDGHTVYLALPKALDLRYGLLIRH